MSLLLQHFLRHWKEKQFPRQGTLLLALSGGVDSMVLATLLRQAGFSFAVAHCNFSLRGTASNEDAQFVQQWAADWKIECHQTQFDTRQIAAQRHQSIQLAARTLRYQWFEELRLRHGYAAILTAHHADDVAETLLINLCRGAGIAGLHGIPERNGHLLRPLLFASRSEIMEYAAQESVGWREDASNAEEKYLRNAMRHRVLPTLDELMPGATVRIAQTAARLHDAEQIYRDELAKILGRLKEERGRDVYVPIRLLVRQKALPTLAFELFTPYGFSSDQTAQILRLLHSESGHQVVSESHRVIRHRDFLVVTSRNDEASDLITIQKIPSTIQTAHGRFSFEWMEQSALPAPNANTALLDGDSVSLPLTLRHRREGDYFYPLGMGMKKKKLKRFLIDAKLPISEKERVLILESQGRILWVVGHRIDERFKLHATSRRILKLSFQPQ